MGLFSRVHRRVQERQDDARSVAEAWARDAGRPEHEVRAVGDAAARRARRRAVNGYGGAGGTS